MQRPWDARLWLPTIRPDKLSYHDWKPPKPECIDKHMRQLALATARIAALPYDPEAWLERASVLNVLGYPELCVGDAYKARMLVDAAQSHLKSPFKDHVRLVVGLRVFLTTSTKEQKMLTHALCTTLESQLVCELNRLNCKAWSLLITGLGAANAFIDQLAFCKRGAKLFGADATKEMTDSEGAQARVDRKTEIARQQLPPGQERQSAIRNGSILSRPYPWMTTDLLHRPDSLIKTMAEELETFSEGRATVRKSNIQKQKPDEALGEDVLGIYALRNLKEGEQVLVDRTTFAVTFAGKDRCALCCRLINWAVGCPNPVCPAGFCSKECLASSTLAGHLAICGRAISFPKELGTEDPTKFTRGAKAKLLMRYLEFIIQHMTTVDDQHLHPLQVLPVMRLTPKYAGSEIIPFNLLDDIVHPFNMLQTLGIDIFADHRFDTWVLFTMRFRLANNVVGITMKNRDYVYGVYPMMAVLNHSCDPSVKYNREGTDATIILTATRDIAKGEEIFTSYLSDPQNQSLGERRSALMAWLGTSCKCSRCLKEERWHRFGHLDSPKQTLPTLRE